MELHIGEAFSIDPGYLVTERSAVIGQSGSGKSYLVSVICEELTKNNLGFAVIDTEGEYSGLSKHFPDQIKSIDIESLSKDEEQIQQIITKSKKIVLDVSDLDVSDTEQKKIISAFLTSTYRVATQLFKAGSDKQIPFLIVVEEADIYVPQQGKNGLPILETISKRGRKRGLGVLFATQRPALVNKNVLTQCNNVFIGRLTHKVDIDSVRIFFSSMDDARQLTRFEPGEFYVQGTISDPSFIKVRQRESKHGGATPTIKSSDATADQTSQSEVRTSQHLDESEDARVQRALDTMRGAKNVSLIHYDEIKALNALNNNKRKTLILGTSESVMDVKRLMLPVFSVNVREVKKRLLGGTKFVDYRVLIDAITGDILSPDSMHLRSENLRYLIDLNDVQLKVMDFIVTNKGASYAQLREVLPGKRFKPSLKKLEEMNLIGLKDDTYFPLLNISYPKSLESQNADSLKISNGRADYVTKPEISKQKLNELVRGLYPGCEVLSVDTIYSTVLKVIYARDSKKRPVRIDALTGKTIHSE
ncbi:MAG: ATP-binding protein [Halobacteriota archaeon]